MERYMSLMQQISKAVDCSYCYRLLCTNDNFSKPFESYLSENDVYNLINIMVEERKNYSDMTKKHFKKELVMTTKDNEDFKNSPKCWILDVFYAN